MLQKEKLCIKSQGVKTSSEATRKLFLHKENKNNNFIQQFVSSTSAYFGEYPPDASNLHCSMSAAPYGYVFYVCLHFERKLCIRYAADTEQLRLNHW